MILSPRKPPNLKKIRQAFPHMNPNSTLFAYGEILYNPGKIKVSPDMWEHEETHYKQQKNYTKTSKMSGLDEWWDRYMRDESFRLSQEIEAYRAQFKMIKQMILIDSICLKLLDTLAKHLSGPMYGNMIGFEEAKRTIQNG